MAAITFTSTATDIDVAFKAARVSKADVLRIGMEYYNATGAQQDELLEEHGGRLVRRSLRAIGNYAARTGQADVAKYAAVLRDQIEFHGTARKTA